MDNYVPFHVHSDLSILDSATKFERYILKAKELNMKAIGFSEHGNIYQWIKKKQLCDKNKIKYIHAQEFYITERLFVTNPETGKEERVRDNWHCVLISKNLTGVKELNKLSSLGYTRDGHFYYDPRITLDELMGTSDNIIVSSACLGGILNGDSESAKDKFIRFMKLNRDRCFLEVQMHLANDQQIYNKELYELSKKHGIPLILGTDTHSIDQDAHAARKILQLAKNISYPDDGIDLIFKTYEELLDSLSQQKALPKDAYMDAIENTNRMADMVENFELDLTFKYPKLYDNSEQVFLDKIYSSKLLKNADYKNRVEYEIGAIKKNGAIDYFLLQENITSWCNKNEIYQGYSRGSISGSLCAYILGITNIDPVKWNTNFDRFMNPERVSLSDIDVDYPPNRRDHVKKYIFGLPNLYCTDIITFNTLAKKGAIRDVCRALGIHLSTADLISKSVDTQEEEKYRQVYPELFKYVDLLQGVITSVGSHPCGSITSPIDIEGELGTFISSTSEYPISQVDMKCVDSLNFVKLDILGLDNIQVINETCVAAGIERLTPDNTDFNDEKVWNSILDNNIAIFQWESDFAGMFYRKLFDKSTIAKIKSKSKKFSYLDLFSMGNGAIRPGGEPYRDKMSEGIFNDNGHEALNNFLEPTLNYLVYQEQVIEFLNKFCGFTMGAADLVRRGFAKKTGTEQFIPQIKAGFIKTMKELYGTSEEESEEIVIKFLEVIAACSDYLFAYNHSIAYSMIGYACAWLRYYYPGEFLTSLLNINSGDIEKTSKIVEYARSQKIDMKNVKFRKSSDAYTYDKDTNTIYKGISSIKFCNADIGKELYSIRDLQFGSFVEFLAYVEDNLSVNSRQIEILIKINMFDEFGGNKKLLEVYQEFLKGKNRYDKKHSDKTKVKRMVALNEIEQALPSKLLSMVEQVQIENDVLGYVQITYDVDRRHIFIMGIDTKFSPKIIAYCLNNAKVQMLKVSKKMFAKNPFNVGDILYVNKFLEKQKKKCEDGKFVNVDNEFEWWLEEYEIKTKEFNEC